MTQKEREDMFFKHEKLIWYVIWKYYRGYVDIYSELYQVGAVALWKVILNFDKEKGKFSTYAISTIRYLIKSSILNRNNMYNSNGGYVYKLICIIIKNKELKDINEIYKIAKEELNKNLSYETFNAIYYDVVSKTNIEDLTYNSKEDNENGVLNLDSGFNLEQTVEENEMLEYYLNIVHKISNKCSCSSTSIYIDWLSKIWYGTHVTYDMLGDKYGISKERVRQIISNMNRKMCKYLTNA